MALFDKTGTLTQDRITLAHTHRYGGHSADTALALAQALAAHSLHPAAQALLQAPCAAAAETASAVRETAGQGLSGQIDHAGQTRTLRLGRAAWCGLAPELAAAHADAMHVWLSVDGQAAACFVLAENLRPEAPAALQALRDFGLGLGLLSGDTPAAVARLQQQLPAFNISQAACSPQDKLARVQSLQAQGQQVLMVGDGINDGPVLAGAQVSMAMAGAAPLAQVQADVLLLRPDLALVPLAVQHSRLAMRVLRQNLAWALAYNAVAIPLAFAGFITPWIASVGMAASSLMVLGNASRLRQIRQHGQKLQKNTQY
jgi:Cu2+-exporting ATPase